MITACPDVNSLKRFRSSGICQRSLLFFPIALFSSTATNILKRGLAIGRKFIRLRLRFLLRLFLLGLEVRFPVFGTQSSRNLQFGLYRRMGIIIEEMCVLRKKIIDILHDFIDL